MDDRFRPGDFLFFQLEAGFALIRVLAIYENQNGTIWHVAGYNDLFPDTESIEKAIADPDSLSVALPNVALTNRAFESTQVAKLGSAPLSESELKALEDSNIEISDRSVRLLLGLR